MFQSHVFFKDYQNNRRFGKRDRYSIEKIFNSMLLAEGERITATFLGNFSLPLKYIKINRKNAPNRVSNCHYNTTKRIPMERTSYSTYVIDKGEEYSFELKQNAVFAAQELGIKPAARKFKLTRILYETGKRDLSNRAKKGFTIEEKALVEFRTRCRRRWRKRL
ncbi:hypothetical protein [Waddlia chondrophila]|uniref:hypothetical protein n=1 Tax=Waddlia chondrophila TaxID=71667 RepID=UPI0005A5143D|nr:hypothetical protein [Waddlia chondrophila]